MFTIKYKSLCKYLVLSSSLTALSVAHGQITNKVNPSYGSSDGRVVVNFANGLFGPYMRSVIIRSNNCEVTRYAGVIAGKVHDRVSVNWGQFDWITLNGENIYGTLANPALETAGGTISWGTLSGNGCTIPAQTNVNIYPFLTNSTKLNAGKKLSVNFTNSSSAKVEIVRRFSTAEAGCPLWGKEHQFTLPGNSGQYSSTIKLAF
ncbi:hypothetical protein, partial [Facilibium subflavum]|uniref:hypothetical protein n=1 Tax=Facilibium subflavum TaxID=2219058 RepID=UPI0013C2C6C1